MTETIITVSDIAKHFRVRVRTVYHWVKKSESEDWSHASVPEPVQISSGKITKRFWLPKQLTEWEIWYRQYLRDKAYQTLIKSDQVKKEQEQ